ncbi:hypothetical protein TEQG_00481 [Trichophyton equinum CBS 127.97]|uniref:Uncharacterized protein n=1 Tax=Trichophyton equinum (strain ATCC MYA-4606 / CBS 127.97) TaxID=559882 RepID=F2PIP3_TRIEC|nr:hypothetical protein TEQG_00481 [Trichophyton equinum CBS 127.97]
MRVGNFVVRAEAGSVPESPGVSPLRIRIFTQPGYLQLLRLYGWKSLSSQQQFRESSMLPGKKDGVRMALEISRYDFAEEEENFLVLSFPAGRGNEGEKQAGWQ